MPAHPKIQNQSVQGLLCLYAYIYAYSGILGVQADP